MKFFKYPLMIIAACLLLIVLFWDDIKSFYTKISNKMQVKFGTNTNNPFNIKANKANKWQGKTTKEGASFESFDTLENGVRAGIKILKAYFSKYGLNTVRGIITRFAPSNENNTENYIKFVSTQLGVTADAELTPDKTTLWKLSRAVCKMENGYDLNLDVYEAAYKLA